MDTLHRSQALVDVCFMLEIAQIVREDNHTLRNAPRAPYMFISQQFASLPRAAASCVRIIFKNFARYKCCLPCSCAFGHENPTAQSS